jgi:hypothetical protein
MALSAGWKRCGRSHEVAALRPQAAPALGRRSLSHLDLDQPLLGALVARWEHCFATGNETVNDRRLFRALEMARAASKMPGGADATEYDAGRAAALWVSAFEILVHDGKRADFGRVLSQLAQVEWITPKLTIQDREVTYKKKTIQTNLAGTIYWHLYNARNKFIHGDPVTIDTLMLEKCRKQVQWFAAPLFRLALTAFLDLRSPQKWTDAANEQELGRYIGSSIGFRSAQRRAEEALLIADEAPAQIG